MWVCGGVHEDSIAVVMKDPIDLANAPGTKQQLKERIFYDAKYI